jgi:hypothetical protein
MFQESDCFDQSLHLTFVTYRIALKAIQMSPNQAVFLLVMEKFVL